MTTETVVLGVQAVRPATPVEVGIRARVRHAFGAGFVAETWAFDLSDMYLRWAQRAGHEVVGVSYLGGVADHPLALYYRAWRITGADVYATLRGERGIHQMTRISVLRPDLGRQEALAEVRVWRELARPEWRRLKVVRTYTCQPYTLVHDLRTNAQTDDVDRVLRGWLDPFLPPVKELTP